MVINWYIFSHVIYIALCLSSFFFSFDCCVSERADIKQLTKDYDKTEDDLKAVQNAGQIIAEVLKQLDDDRCQWNNQTRTHPQTQPISFLA